MKLKILFIIIILFTINLILLFQNVELKKRIKNNLWISQTPFLQIIAVPDFVLYDLKGIEFTSQEILYSAPYLVFIFFSLDDCITCQIEKELLLKINNKDNIEMTAIVQHIDERELKIWVENENFPFPILFDQDSKVTKAFGVNKTPLMIVSDSMGNIISVGEINNMYNKKKEFIKMLDEITGV